MFNRLLSERNLPTIFVKLAGVFYAGLKLLPTRNKVVLISRNNLHTSIDFALLNDEITKQHPTARVVILNHYMRSKISHIFDILVEMYHLATSRACIIDSYVIAVSILHHKKDLKIIQIWHALGAIKQFGHMTLDKKAGHSSRIAKVMNMHGNYDFITCGSRATIPIFTKAFNAPSDIIKPIGMPRIDYLLNKQVQKQNIELLRQKYPVLRDSDKEVILYAPTFRRLSKIHPDELINQINLDKYTLIIKQHRLDKTVLPENNHIIQIKDELESLQILPIADHVITDYSAITFEAALLDKPLYFWAYDLDSYDKNCGLAINYTTEMPGPINADPSAIIQSIENHQSDPKKVQTFAKKWLAVRNGTCTQKIVELLAL